MVTLARESKVREGVVEHIIVEKLLYLTFWTRECCNYIFNNIVLIIKLIFINSLQLLFNAADSYSILSF